jgi:hypothetical protein
MNNKPNYLKMAVLIVSLTSLWAVGGYMAGAALEILGFNSYSLSLSCASLNVIIGLALFTIITSDPTFEQIFFDTKRFPTTHIGYQVVRALWTLPLALLFMGLLMWFWAIIINLFIKE